jgi:hypothetical protein
MRWPQLIRAALAALALMMAAASATLAYSGQTIATDSGWNTGWDNPDGLTGTYSVDNVWQDFYLSEWNEPYHDWARDRWNRWGPTAEAKLNNESSSKGLGFQLTIIDQYWYNFTGNWNTNLPWSKGAENENVIEELIQGYTEVDTEIQDPVRINVNYNYYIDYQIDQERQVGYRYPVFYSEIEWCDNWFLACNYDLTGTFAQTTTTY